MNNSDSNTADSKAAEKNTDFGSLLAKARKSQNYTVEEVCIHIKIPVHTIHAIEASNIEALPAPTYTQGYIRAYARFLELSEDDVLALYNKAVPRDLATDLKPRSNLPGEASSQTPLVKTVSILLVFAGIVTLIFGSLQYYRDKSEVMETELESKERSFTGNSLDSPGSAAISIKQNAHITEQGELIVEQSQALESKAEDSDANEDAAAIDTTEQAATVTQTDTETVAVIDNEPEVQENETVVQESEPVTQQVPERALPQDTLIIIAAEGSWVQVHDASNARLLYNMIPVGGSRTLTGQAPFRVSLGNAKTTRVVINDLEVDMSAYIRSKNTARFTVSSEQKNVIFH